MDWDENRIVIAVDGEVLNDSDLNQAANPDGKNGFRQAHSIILNLAIGGQLRVGIRRNPIPGAFRSRLRAGVPIAPWRKKGADAFPAGCISSVADREEGEKCVCPLFVAPCMAGGLDVP